MTHTFAACAILNRRHRFARGISITLLSLWLVGCGASPFADRRVDTTSRLPVVLSIDTTHANRGDPLPREPVASRVSGKLTLRDAIAVAIRTSPRLAGFAWHVRAMDARIVQADLPPNPKLSFGSENFGGSSGSDHFKRHTLRVSQVLETDDKRAKRQRLAQTIGELAAWDYQSTRLEVIANVARRFVSVIAAQDRLRLAQRNLDLAEQIEAIVVDHVKAGLEPESALHQIRVDTSTARVKAQRLAHTLAVARQHLVEAWGDHTADFSLAVGDLAETVAPLDRAALLEHIHRNPQIARWPSEARRWQHQLELAQAIAVPDVTVGIGIRQFPNANDTAGVFEVSIPLKVADRNEGEILEARHRLARTQEQARAATAAMHAVLIQTHEQLLSASLEIDTYLTEAIPGAQAVLASARARYEVGTESLVESLEAERATIRVDQALLSIREAFHHRVATLESLIAGPIDAPQDARAENP